jgi:lipooligosaccharide transport system ATP-binding protein
VATQALSGIAKDLDKMSAKASIKTMVADGSYYRLFKWAAMLTGPQNAPKGAGFFIGAAAAVIRPAPHGGRNAVGLQLTSPTSTQRAGLSWRPGSRIMLAAISRPPRPLTQPASSSAPGPRSPVVFARRLRKAYGNQTVVDDIDFDIPSGRCFGFLGPNGAGKTTTLRLILGLTPMSGGELSVFGLQVSDTAGAIRARVGVVPQADNLDPDFTVAENLRIYASYFGIPAKVVDHRIPDLLDFAALAERADARTEQLSGGMKRRLTIARALINEPELVVLDEPTTGLDPQARHVIWGRLMELRRRGVTLLLTTHYMEEAERLCDELVVMDHGRILAQGSPRQLIDRHVEAEVIEVRDGDPGALATLEAQPGCRVERHGTTQYCYAQDAKPLVDRLRRESEITYLHRPANLEDVFLKLTGRELRD